MNYKDILNQLLSLPNSHEAGENEIRMRCPICDKHSNKLYVGVHKSVENLLCYDCKHCGYQGLVNKEFLHHFNIDSDDYIKELRKKSYKNVQIINKTTKLEKLSLNIPDKVLIRDKFKIEYIENRLNREISIEDIKTYKLILNFNQFCKYNGFDPFSYKNPKDFDKNKFLFNEFSKHFLGMMSVDNNRINFRNINSNYMKDMRYYFYKMSDKINTPFLYFPDLSIDIMAKNPIINISEGVFDIIGVRELFYKNHEHNVLFVACGGKGSYIRAINQILKMTMFVGADLNIYADNDDESDKYFYKSLFKNYLKVFNKITIIQNVARKPNGEKSKDFGNLKNPIEIKQYTL